MQFGQARIGLRLGFVVLQGAKHRRRRDLYQAGVHGSLTCRVDGSHDAAVGPENLGHHSSRVVDIDCFAVGVDPITARVGVEDPSGPVAKGETLLADRRQGYWCRLAQVQAQAAGPRPGASLAELESNERPQRGHSQLGVVLGEVQRLQDGCLLGRVVPKEAFWHQGHNFSHDVGPGHGHARDGHGQ